MTDIKLPPNSIKLLTPAEQESTKNWLRAQRDVAEEKLRQLEIAFECVKLDLKAANTWINDHGRHADDCAALDVGECTCGLDHLS